MFRLLKSMEKMFSRNPLDHIILHLKQRSRIVQSFKEKRCFCQCTKVISKRLVVVRKRLHLKYAVLPVQECVGGRDISKEGRGPFILSRSFRPRALHRRVARSFPTHVRFGAVFPEFNMFHMIAVGLSSSILGCLLTLLVYTYCQRYQQQSHDATVIHPVAPAPLNTSITNHINKLDKYDSVEAIKVRERQTEAQGSGLGGWPSSGVVA